MIISHIKEGLGNQLFQYAAGRRLAHKHNTELKLDIDPFLLGRTTHPFYALDQFNISATVAKPEEIATLKKLSAEKNLGVESAEQKFKPELLDYPDNVYLDGYWINEKYFADISDIIRREFTLKKLGTEAQRWQKKILAAECAVSLHFRHGDFMYHPVKSKHSWYAVPFDYYFECLNALKRQYKNLTAFVFSDNLQGVKESLRLDVPTEFVCGGGLSDVENLFLMSQCKHNIMAGGSTFSMWGAWLNQNPDKKVFRSMPSTAEQARLYHNLPNQLANNSPDGNYIIVPFDAKKQLEITLRPYFSLLVVVNNDVATLLETLGTILAQDYKFFELIIIDNASYDDSNKICQQAEKFSDKVTLIKLYNKVSDGAAWNMAFNIAQGDYVMFLKGNDRLVANALNFLYLANESVKAEIINSAMWLRENERGNIAIAGRKFVVESDAPLSNLKNFVRQRLDKLTVLKLLATNATAVPIATKIFDRKFLVDNAIKFDEKISDADAELKFITAAMMSTDKEMLFLPNLFYVAPRK